MLPSIFKRCSLYDALASLSLLESCSTSESVFRRMVESLIFPSALAPSSSAHCRRVAKDVEASWSARMAALSVSSADLHRNSSSEASAATLSLLSITRVKEEDENATRYARSDWRESEAEGEGGGRGGLAGRANPSMLRGACTETGGAVWRFAALVREAERSPSLKE